MSSEIYPTHTCFNDALDLFVELLQHLGPGSEKRLCLVHAICVAPDGHEFAHAWVEDTRRGRAIFTGILDGQRHDFIAPAAEYSEGYGVKESIRYTYAEVFELNRTTGHYGPWVDRYRQLCSNTKRVWQ